MRSLEEAMRLRMTPKSVRSWNHYCTTVAMAVRSALYYFTEVTFKVCPFIV